MNIFICPICSSLLEKNLNSYTCKNNHNFDIAKEGYINLLPINKKKSKLPGDNREMIMARREFLSRGYFDSLAAQISQKIKDVTKENSEYQIFDLGCGEGYYSGYLERVLPDNFNISALDISKVAIRYGAKKFKDVNFCVASAFQIPVKNDSIDILTRIYAPSLDSELYRVIKSGGYLITVTPGPRHLYQLREVLYDSVILHPKENCAPKGFKKVSRSSLKYILEIGCEKDLLNLINMTPFAWKFSSDKRDILFREDHWAIECDFNIEVYVKE